VTERFDYTNEDTSNLVLLEHVNLTVPDQHLATLFYVAGLGLTRDPYLMTGVTNMWINVGRSQIHLPRGQPQRLRGHVALVVGGRSSLLRRLREVKPMLDGTAFEWIEQADRVEVVCPWGNRYLCLDPEKRSANVPWANVDLGIAYVQFDVRPGCAAPIAAFYRDVFEASARILESGGLPQAVIAVGTRQQLVYQESAAPLEEYDGHHIQVYVADFSASHARLAELGLTYGEESHQYRFAEIVDAARGMPCHTLEHEVRSLRHPLYARPLVNRNPEQSIRDYVAGGDARTGLF
jgi:hypothetical protein